MGGSDAVDAALVGDEDPGFRGGSYAVVQKYLHDMDAWERLPAETQEKIIGRTKATNVELDAPGSHKDVNSITAPDGTELRILRAAMPFGRPGHGEFGTYFIAYAHDPQVTETMLERMFLGTPTSAPRPRGPIHCWTTRGPSPAPGSSCPRPTSCGPSRGAEAPWEAGAPREAGAPGRLEHP